MSQSLGRSIDREPGDPIVGQVAHSLLVSSHQPSTPRHMELSFEKNFFLRTVFH